MPRILRINRGISGASSVAGAQLPSIVIDAVLPIDTIASIATVPTRDHQNSSVIRSLTLLVTATGGVAFPAATLTDLTDSARLEQFQSYVKAVLDKVCSSDEVVVVDAREF